MGSQNKLTFLSFIWLLTFLASCDGQVQKTSGKGNKTIFSNQQKLKHHSTNIGENVHGSLQDKKGNLWFATTGDGVYRYDGESFQNFRTEDGLKSNLVSSMVEDKDGQIWFGTTAGLSLFDGTSFTHIPIRPPTNDFVTSMLRDRKGNLWLGTNHDVYIYNGQDFVRFLDDPNIVNSNELTLEVVQSMLEDRDGNIWFATKTEGICRYDGKSLINYTPGGELWFRGLLEDENGNIWAGGRNTGVCRFDGKSFTDVLQNGRFDECTVFSILQDKAGDMWFGTAAGDPSEGETYGGAWHYDGEAFVNFSAKDGLGHNGVWSLLEGENGDIWVGTGNTGLFRFDGKSFADFSEEVDEIWRGDNATILNVR